MEREIAGNSVSVAFSGLFEMPPMDVIIYLPVAEKNSKLSLEKLSGEIIWRYKPDWIIFVLGCVVFLAVSFLMVSGLLREI